MNNPIFRIRRLTFNAGFTLIELMVTVSIIAILAAIAVPSYHNYVISGKIPQATSNLASMRVKLEQFYQDKAKYTGACVAGTVAPLPTSDNFTYACTTLTDTTFTVTATGTGPMSGFTYTIDQANNKTTTAVPSGWGTAPVSCWVVKKGGGC
ncbi:type IV pilin protein [Noviherbaspirillum sp.]|jgi:type IV pilus assembly protein PilE|uniref:type IV pilin protein n=1 Tax=Noviherbaspirillum sp. TaxID=1926288 RepID=UPI0025CD1A18|nr:type IV pilin protein [Noviherbaspirillum sp.]